jgi:glycosyltransferase involved in cell wall biosynthesis
MRIAYVCPRYPPQIGGVETHVSSIATRVAARGHEVEVLTLAEGRSATTDRLEGVTVRRFPLLSLLGRGRLPWALWRHMRASAGSWDVVHAHVHASPPAVAAALAANEPFVFTPHFHGFWRSRSARAYALAIRPQAALVLRRASAVICVSNAESDLLEKEFPGVAGRVEVIPNGTSRRPPTGDRDGARAPVVLSLGRLEAYKRVDAVIAALAHVPEMELEVIGDGSARPDLAALAREKGVADRVRFLGRVDDGRVDRALAESRALVTMSMLEAFGLAPLDAVAAGLPVVASDIPAHRELRDRFGPERISLVAGDARPEALARAIARAAAAGPTEPPADLPTWDGVADLTLDLYERLVEARSGSAA